MTNLYVLNYKYVIPNNLYVKKKYIFGMLITIQV